MGCDIHNHVEVKINGIWEYDSLNNFSNYDYKNEKYIKNEQNEPFGWRSYSMFSLLGNVRNYIGIIPISDNRGLPSDVSDDIKQQSIEERGDAHSHSYLTLRELIEYDYDKSYLNENYINGELITEDDIYNPKDFLGNLFFIHLEELKELGDPDNVRIVFWFDN